MEKTRPVSRHFSQWQLMDRKICIEQKPSERFELSTPGLQDQCSNPWATKAIDFTPVFFCEDWNDSFIFGYVVETTFYCVLIPDFHHQQRHHIVNVIESLNGQNGISRRLNNDRCAVTRIRTWVIAATTQCTNHYTITAMQLIRSNTSLKFYAVKEDFAYCSWFTFTNYEPF